MDEWLRSDAHRFGTITAADDALHGMPEDKHFSVTETVWFEVLIPERGIVGQIYVMTRPNLGMCHAGVWIHRGSKSHQMLMEHFDYRMALPMPLADGSKLTLPDLGLTIDVVKPLAIVDVRYEPPESSTRLHFRATAITPAAMRANSKHFEQFMHLKGQLVLDGERIEINHAAPRDRSWGEKRPETPLALPVAGWCAGIFDEGRIAFNLNGSDDPAAGAEWSRAYGVSTQSAFRDGWYCRDGVLKKVVGMSMFTTRDPLNRMQPCAMKATFQDEDGVTHTLSGKPQSASELQLWPNLQVWVGLMEWELDGQTGYGDLQQFAWADYCKRFWKSARA